MILASLEGTATVGASPFPVLPGTALVTADGAPSIAVEVDGSPGAAAFPRRAPGTVPIVGLAVYLDGTLVPASRFLEGWDLTLANAPLNRWTLVAKIAPGPFGAPTRFLGAAPGSSRIDIRGLYLTGTGLHEIPLVTNGKVDNEQRQQQQDGSTVTTIQGVDAWARFDHRLITLNLPPGHNLTRDAVIARGAVAAGFGAIALTGGGRMLKAFQAVNQEFGSALQPLADVEGWTLCIDRAGSLSNPVTAPNPGARIDITLTDRDIVFGTAGAQIPGDSYTRIVFSGTQQVQADDSIRVVTERQVAFSLYAPKMAAFSQETDGSLSATGMTAPPATLTMTSLVETTTTYRGLTVLSVAVATSAFYNPRVARYAMNADGSLSYIAGGLYGPVYLYGGAAPGDNADAYHLPRELFMVVARQLTTYNYDDRGYLISTVTAKDMPWFRGAAVKARDNASQTWESRDFIAGRLVLGNRAGVDNGGATPGLESFPSQGSGSTATTAIAPREITTVTYEVTTDGHITKQTTLTQSYLAPGGSLWLFGDGNARSIEEEALLESTRDELFYGVVSGGAAESSHTEATLHFVQGALVSQEGPNTAASYLPAATLGANLSPPSADFPDSVPASSQQSAPWTAEYISHELEGTHDRAEEVGSSPWAESVYEGQRMAMWKILKDAASSCSVTLPANWLIAPTHHIIFAPKTFDLFGEGDFPGVRLGDLVVRHTLQSGTLPTTIVTGKVYLAAA